MPTTCIVVGCGSRANREKISFFRVPVRTNYAFRTDLNELSRKRRAKWLAAIKRSDLTEAKIKCEKVCSRHFLTGKPAQLPDVDHPDWAPSLHMGYSLGGSKERGTKQKKRDSLKKKAKMDDDEDIDKICVATKPTFTATVEVPSEVLPKLVCDNCGGYLSRGPVYLMDIDKYWCGRCLPSEEEQGTRIEAYEELAKLMTFPCRYQENGCTSKVPFAENEAHEEACPYRKLICPIAESDQCEWTGIQTELLEHCQQQHPDNVVENPCTFTHNITRSSLHNYLLWTLGVLFLIQTKVCTATRKIYHSVRLISDPANASDYKYTLCIQNKDSVFSKHREVAPRGCLALQHDSAIQTDINGLLTMLEDFTGTTFTVTVESTGNGTTESSVAESSRANTRNITAVQTIEANVKCSKCATCTEPVYRDVRLVV